MTEIIPLLEILFKFGIVITNKGCYFYANNFQIQTYGADGITARIMELVNIVDSFYLLFNIRIILSHIEMWNQGNYVSGINAFPVSRSFESVVRLISVKLATETEI